MKQPQNGIALVFAQLSKYSEWLYNALFFTIIMLIVFFHSYKLDTIPLGLFFDESTIGVHASNLTQTGLDAYNGETPLFFKSDADYDSPILIYTTAAFFKLFGVSEFTLRLPNVLFFSIALLLTFLLAFNIFGNNKLLLMYFLAAFGFLPQFFTLSRLSFEVISQLATISGAFLCIWWTFHEQRYSKINKYGKAIITGFLIGISTYTYSTANLLSALLMASLIALYFNYKNLKVLAVLTVSCLVALIPYGIFSIKNPSALTSRFQNISFIFESIPLIEKMQTFLENYLSNWSLGFLIFRGDENLRHSTGVGGTIFISVFILFLIGLTALLFRKKMDKFTSLLLVNLLFTPVASALTSEGNPHAIRTLLMGYFIVLFSCYGFQFLSHISPKPLAIFLVSCIYITIGYEASKYQLDYFTQYAARSVSDMGSYDFYGSLDFALAERPKEVIFFDNFFGGLDNFIFYSRIIANPMNIPIKSSQNPIPESGVCIIYRRETGAEEELDIYSIPYQEFGSRYRPSEIEKRLGVDSFFGVMKSRCYHP